jgi:thymidylate synthase (FAD)
MNIITEKTDLFLSETTIESPVKIVCVTPHAEKMSSYIARVSNPSNQNNENFAHLLAYCIKHAHWSVFEHAYMTMEINTSRAIATQILRHRSFTFQHFSQRYADNSLLASTIPLPELRSQDHKNRQNSIDNFSAEEKTEWNHKINMYLQQGFVLYKELLEGGVAKECARFILPQTMPDRLYMTGNIRSWIHYIELRSGHGTQKEHMIIAQACKALFVKEFPIIAQALQELKPAIWL